MPKRATRTNRKATAGVARPSPEPDNPAPEPTPQDRMVPEPCKLDTTVEPEPTEPSPIEGIQVTETPPARRVGRPAVKEADFFRRLADWPANDWKDGKLIIYVYRIEPYTDRHAGGAKYVFLTKYTSPIDEENLLLDHGSGKYRFMLNRDVDGHIKTIDTKELEILHPKYPPAVPPGEWVNDPRNKKWAWAAPKDAPTVAPATDPVSIAKEILAMIQASTPTPPAQNSGQTADLVKALLPVPGEYVETLTKMKALAGGGENTTVTTLIIEQVAALRAELKEERANNRDLINKLIDARTAPPTKAPDLAEQITSALTVVRRIKDELTGEGALPSAGRSHMSGWQEFLAPAIEHLSQHLAPAFTAMLTPAGTATAGNPPGVAARPPADLATHLRTFLSVREPMLTFLNDGATGGEFAAWFAGGYGDLQYQAIRAAGADRIISVFRNSPMWAQLGPIEQRFTTFVREFTEWTEEAEAPAGPGEAPSPTQDMSDAPPIDLTEYVSSQATPEETAL
jgi:hypothetical protein